MHPLVNHLRESLLAGDVETTRDSNYSNAASFAEGRDGYLFGLPPLKTWTHAEVLAVMAERVGIDPDPGRATGTDVIDPHKTIRALERMRDRLRLAAQRKERVIVASGHPAGIIEVHMAVAAALKAAGCTLLQPAAGTPFARPGKYDGREFPLAVRYIGGVAVGAQGVIALWHTHSPDGMRAMLAELEQAGEAMPDLVVADHGFAGAAAAAGLDVVSFADSNDPALFIGEAEGRVSVAVPIDDNVQPQDYWPVSAFLLDGVVGATV
ncbi:phosphatase [Dactylosporangium matsuzakiense]|uniref:Phosphatase n=1 Tax=Dactylosporangium matsuzakiense TaxID=53360 RepID=A0A9W6NP97_9ACTN|nr:phosphatase [Dactylosporangium matsuzakiense]UWZ43589.1 phosphatase [Dactylosporangium matsuzakiense]GLL04078.1 putative phosphatase [Dactylosporangium matsuzakiense]